MKKDDKLHNIFNAVSFTDQSESRSREALTADDIFDALSDLTKDLRKKS